MVGSNKLTERSSSKYIETIRICMHAVNNIVVCSMAGYAKMLRLELLKLMYTDNAFKPSGVMAIVHCIIDDNS